MKFIWALVVCLLVFFTNNGKAAQLVNGDFGTGDFTGWTQFNTVNGGTTTPKVVLFDLTGTGGFENAAKFEVGEVSGIIGGGGLGAGAGIEQSVNLNAGTLNVFLDIAANGNPNADAGTFQLLLDGNAVATYPFGKLGFNQTLNATLSFSGTVSSGAHEIAIDMLRGGGFSEASATPYQYLGNISISGSATAVPEPASLSMLMVGITGLTFHRRRKATDS